MEGRDEANSDTFEVMQRRQNRWAGILSRTRHDRQKNILSLK